MFSLCTPSIIYLIFSITQILIDLYKGLFNTAFMKVIVASMVTLLLNILCEKGLDFVSWLIVFIPFILMTIMVSMLLYVFGLDAAKGTFDYTCKDQSGTTTSTSTTTSNLEGVTTDAYGNIIIYDPEYKPLQRPVYYKSPNIIVPNPHANDVTSDVTIVHYQVPPTGSSNPEYTS